MMIPMKLISLIKMFLNEAHDKSFTGKHLSNSFHIHNDKVQGDALSPLLLNLSTFKSCH
jgi:hypothetical protein